jgi:chitinase
MYSLAMVTKAGVPANKIMVGISSYGRSFKMADAKCKGPMCTFLGGKENSPAMKGECTGEGGYLADAEIRATRNAAEWWGEGYEAYYDKDSDSDIVIYNGDEWVAFMDHETKKRRVEEYRKLGFLGTTDWAIDLQKDFNADDLYSGDKDQINDVVVDLGPKRECVLNKNYKDLQAVADDAEGKDPWCLAAKTVEILGGMMNNAFDGYDAAASGYDGLFPTYEKYMLDTLNARLAEWLWDKDEKKAGWPHYRCFYDEGISRAKRSDAQEYKCNDAPSEYLQDYTYVRFIRISQSLHSYLHVVTVARDQKPEGLGGIALQRRLRPRLGRGKNKGRNDRQRILF